MANKIFRNLSIGSLAVIILIGAFLFFNTNEKENSLSAKNLEVNGSLIQKSNDLQVMSLPMSISTSVEPKNTLTLKKNTMPIVKIQTNKGDIELELFQDDAPKTVENFITLAKKGFYNEVIFHRVISGFMIQGGDPTGTGMGGPGYKFADELNPESPSYQTGYVRGILAMANSGPNTNGSQFFIMHKDYPLPHDYTIFGRVISGIETVDAITRSKTDSSDRPLEEVVMEKVEVVE